MEKFHLMDYEIIEAKEQMFPFDIYLFNPANQKYVLFLEANSPFTTDMRKIYALLLSKGNKLAVKDGQQLTFQRSMELSSEEIEKSSHAVSAPSNEQKVSHSENNKTNQNESFVINPLLKEEGEFNLNQETVQAFDQDDFMRIIFQVRKEIMSFPFNISPTVSLAIDFAQKLLTEDTKTNRVACMSFFLAKFGGIADINALCDLFVAGIIHQTGLTQLELDISRTPILDLQEKKQRAFRRTEGLTQHLVKKSGLEISDRCIKTILESQERADGSGYPNMKRKDHIEPLALILGCINHIFEFCDGRITGKKTSIWTTIRCLENRTSLPGLDLQFGEQVIDNVVYLIKKRVAEKTDLEESKVA